MIDDYECSIDLMTALDWQRSSADIVRQFIVNKQNWLEENHCKFWEDWKKDVFTLSTANDFGLSVWAIILDESINGYAGSSPDDYPNFGFSDDAENFYNGSFAVDDGYTIEFTTEQKRIILQLKAFQVLAISGPVIQINKAMANIFGEGAILAFDRFDMSFVYQLNDKTISNFIREIRDRDLLPRPIGINADTIRTLDANTFGFSDDDQNFSNGNFFNGDI